MVDDDKSTDVDVHVDEDLLKKELFNNVAQLRLADQSSQEFSIGDEIVKARMKISMRQRPQTVASTRSMAHVNLRRDIRLEISALAAEHNAKISMKNISKKKNQEGKKRPSTCVPQISRGKPFSLDICPHCHREFGSASFLIHIKKCRFKPSANEIIWNPNNETKRKSSGFLVPCPICSRKFLPEHIWNHQQKCSKKAVHAQAQKNSSKVIEKEKDTLSGETSDSSDVVFIKTNFNDVNVNNSPIPMLESTLFPASDAGADADAVDINDRQREEKDALDNSSQLVQCRFCRRNFDYRRIQKHQDICREVSANKNSRPIFNSQRQRASPASQNFVPDIRDYSKTVLMTKNCKNTKNDSMPNTECSNDKTANMKMKTYPKRKKRWNRNSGVCYHSNPSLPPGIPEYSEAEALRKIETKKNNQEVYSPVSFSKGKNVINLHPSNSYGSFNSLSRYVVPSSSSSSSSFSSSSCSSPSCSSPSCSCSTTNASHYAQHFQLKRPMTALGIYGSNRNYQRTKK